MSLAAIEKRLKAIGRFADDDVPVVETLILLGALDLYAQQEHETPPIDLKDYHVHIAELHEALNDAVAAYPHEPSEDLAQWRLDRLKDVLFDQFHYHGDYAHEGFKDPEKINFLDVLKTRSGIPVALGALFYELAHARQWPIYGLNFPGHFIMRLDVGASRLIFDPFNEGRVLDAPLLRQLLKQSVGQDAELHHDYYDTVSPRDMILRFCNNRKIRFLQLGHYEEALNTVQAELWIAPDEPLLYFDGGILAAKMDMLAQAIEYFTNFVHLSDDMRSVAEAKSMILSLQRKLQ